MQGDTVKHEIYKNIFYLIFLIVGNNTFSISKLRYIELISAAISVIDLIMPA